VPTEARRGLTAATGLSWSGADEFGAVGKAAGGEWESSRRISNQDRRRARVEFGREAQCAVNNRRPCRGNRARPNGAARPTWNDGKWKQKREDAATGRNSLVDSQSGGSGVHLWRSSPSGAPSTFGGEGHHQDSTPPRNVSWSPRLAGRPLRGPPATRCSESGRR
jgi:hypothetical protein